MKTRLLLILILFLELTSLQAQAKESIPRLVLSEVQDTDLSKKVSYFSLLNLTNLPKNEGAAANWLSQLPAHESANPFGDQYVVAFYLHNDLNQEQWFLYPYGSVVETVTTLSFSQSKQSIPVITGHGQDNQYDYHYGMQVNLPKGETTLVVMHFDSDFYFAPIKLLALSPQAADKQFTQENLILILCLGICLALAIYNLFIYWGSGERLYMFYAISTFAYTWGWANVFGVIQLITGSTVAIWIAPAYLVGSTFTCLFVIEFLQLRKTSKGLVNALKTNAALSLIVVPFAAYTPGVGIMLASVSTSAVVIMGLYVGIRAWYRGYSPARYFVMALIVVMLPNMVGNLMNLGVLPALNVNIYLLGLIGNALDALLLAFAMAEKVRLINESNRELTNRLEYKVERRTKALVEANKALEVSNQQLIEADNAKGRFLANMSHEIRTPLTSIIGYADGIILGDIDKAEQDRVMRIIAENGTHLLSIINDILDISKIEADKLDYEFIPTALFPTLAQLESLVSKRARDKGLAFHLDYQYPLPSEITTDPTRLKQILFNLTNNAIKFTDQGYVGISVSQDNDKLVIQVKDSGIGMTPDQLQNLFTPFQQAENSINRRFGGTGLGLSISRRLARGLGGDITASSTPNQGSQFTLTINLQIADNSEWINQFEEIWRTSNKKSLKDVELPDFSGNRVLLADDHPSNRELVSILLKRMNIDVTAVENGKQALDAVIKHRFDLILMDIHMPELDGVSAFKQIRSLGNYTPVIALTANNMRQEIDQYLQIGFADHLAKPLSRKHFVEKLGRFLSSVGITQSLISTDDMKMLIGDYIKDLDNQLTFLENAWEERNLEEVADIAHRIKGSAGSFGLTGLGKQYAELEHAAKQGDEVSISAQICELLDHTRTCTNLPGVDVAQAIVNHGNDLDSFIDNLKALLTKSTEELVNLSRALDQGSLNEALVSLHKIFPELRKTAVSRAVAICEELEGLIKANDLDDSHAGDLVDELKQLLEVLGRVLGD